MTAESQKNAVLRGVFIGLIANSIILWSWLPLMIELEPGANYRHPAGIIAIILAIPAPMIYGVILAFKKTKHRLLKFTAVILNFTPLGVLVLLVWLLALMGHHPAE